MFAPRVVQLVSVETGNEFPQDYCLVRGGGHCQSIEYSITLAIVQLLVVDDRNWEK